MTVWQCKKGVTGLEEDEKCEEQATTKQILTDHVSVVKERSKRVDNTDQFFIVVRRASNFTRRLNLWQRESKQNRLDKGLKVHFTGEKGIDSGAMSKAFLAQAISDIRNMMFPGGSRTIPPIMYRMVIFSLVEKLLLLAWPRVVQHLVSRGMCI